MQTFRTSRAKENILAKIRKALNEEKAPMPYPDADADNSPIYPTPSTFLEEIFAENFISLGGKFLFCENEQELLGTITALYDSNSWSKLLCADPRLLKLFQNNRIDIVSPADEPVESADACITGCEALVARTGSTLISSKQHLGRTAPVYYPAHIVFAFLDQVVFDISDALELIKKKYGNDMPSMVNLATGPSRTADIEKTLVVGVHGPAEVYCILINSESE